MSAALPALIQRFFTDRLCIQLEASRHTVAGYRDTFRLLLRYASAQLGKPPVKLRPDCAHLFRLDSQGGITVARMNVSLLPEAATP